MVKLNKIYTRTGDDGTTGLGTGERRLKSDLRVDAYGTVDEANACIGLARLHTAASHPAIDAMLSRIQNDLFDLGADLAVPDDGKPLGYEPLRIIASQTDRVEKDIDLLNKDLQPLKSFVLQRRHAGCGRASSCPHRGAAGRAASWWRWRRTRASTSTARA